MGDSIGLLQLGAAVGRGTMTVGVEYHGGLGGMGIGNPMVISVVKYWLVYKRARKICTREYVEIKRRCAHVKSILKF